MIIMVNIMCIPAWFFTDFTLESQELGIKAINLNCFNTYYRQFEVLPGAALKICTFTFEKKGLNVSSKGLYTLVTFPHIQTP